MTLRVVYRGGTFRPEGECHLEEGTQGIVVVERPSEAPMTASPEERRRLLAELVERMKNNPLPPDSPRLTRDQMHDRD
ncbi:MAG TPA: antitoxin family protein [Bryobacteraceae bacterium]|nr:antitoxin family protein [Bryobacteraceae bacterium]